MQKEAGQHSLSDPFVLHWEVFFRQALCPPVHFLRSVFPPPRWRPAFGPTAAAVPFGKGVSRNGFIAKCVYYTVFPRAVKLFAPCFLRFIFPKTGRPARLPAACLGAKRAGQPAAVRPDPTSYSLPADSHFFSPACVNFSRLLRTSPRYASLIRSCTRM